MWQCDLTKSLFQSFGATTENKLGKRTRRTRGAGCHNLCCIHNSKSRRLCSLVEIAFFLSFMLLSTGEVMKNRNKTHTHLIGHSKIQEQLKWCKTEFALIGLRDPDQDSLLSK